MKQTAKHEITVRIRTQYPQEDWAALVSDALNNWSVAGKGMWATGGQPIT